MKIEAKDSSQKYFLHLAYKGTKYQGWQRQTNGLGIQAVIEDQLSRMFKQKVTIHGCGRTDAGVHARQYFCHTVIQKAWDFDAVFRLNKMLPEDIRVYAFIPVDATANAQLDVSTRTYDYHIHLTPDPFLAELSTYYPLPTPNFEAMQAAVHLLTQYQDFRSFCKQPDVYKSTICTVSFAALSINADQTRLRFRITANRFLRAMIRMIVGNLVKIGQGEMDLVAFEAQLKTPALSTIPLFAYPQGLYLAKVEYPYLVLD